MLELDSYQDLLEDFRDKGCEIVAICPEKPEIIQKMFEEKTFDFHVVSDKDNEFARKLGLVYTMEEKLNELYKGWNINFSSDQGNDKNELPVPATIVIDGDNKVVDLFVETDYTYRYEPEDVLNKL
ncbi:redoxin domain-containing protein [Acidaminobacter sp. JC074]|uniref:redoxin domain-containing protein n=1 Tax=Acidaminobacter sp. JC074 TaxID=2530199 RepID=UPI001F103FB1|nr:redoxin domain-containing protein [Acidaminobacter sp. JC074]MCH4887255.1 redoxin domain-containing protein [Acidaminobacter sp. JC074]